MSQEAHIEELLARMTLPQKVGQMTQPERLHITPDEVRDFHIGSVLSGGGSAPGENRPADWVDMNDAYWTASMEENEEHLAIPILYGVDAIHGHNNVRGATVFPHNIGLGCANDPDLMERIAAVTAKEILATGVEWTFAPTLAVARNDHWGRTYESWSEDPERASALAPAFVRGLQGDLGDAAVVACLKHWVGDGGTRDGIDQGETTLPEEELRRLHIAPYLPALEAGALTVMASYNSWNGKKCHGHRYLLTDVLKNELGFEGLVVSDWDGIDQLSRDYAEAVVLSVNAGVDLFMVPEKWRRFIDVLTGAVEAGTVPMARIDDAVRRILRVKHRYGLFQRPRPAHRPHSNSDSFGSEAHRDVAREAVRKSLVLLKHDGDVLPVSREARILVAGRNADDRGHQCGGFTVLWQGSHGNDLIEGGTSIWEGVKAEAQGAVFSRDAAVLDGPGAPVFDVAIVVIGEDPYAEGLGDVRPGGRVELGSALPNPGPQVDLRPYAATLEHRTNHPEDLAVLQKIRARGIPTVTVVVSGRPLVMEAELALSHAFVAAWLPGSEGAGVSDVLFGHADFQGTLAFSWPRADGDCFNRGDAPYDPRFPFGFGLNLGGRRA
jgi:beta-glucosidase